MLLRQQKREGVTVVECAVIFPIVFLLLAGTVIGGIGVFRYQEVAALAREGARFASVRGARYEFDSGKPMATPEDVFNQAILPKAVALDKDRLTYEVTWNPTDKRQGGTVTVRVNYDWIPEAFLGGIQLSSSSTMWMSY
jgi:Flp pilus assembly protein TadG